ncbi:spirocyclase, AveC family [Ketobacter sp. MCCC 1A13808]|uniref:spirocyclase AveC family protein n=1 Tax=Ketobacter sp. MCCC 1A13808 TaxID=2602738 RepID=UPI000F29B714|nr:spirocyclase AveC family protein [Ketobacter sp. MCCC 1A13808]MVF11439.1 spirocyclase, AveC family [Ketobacter sp. MCCC 1A13808]RLP54622.1 MAG: spirocyclase, AveC family [Ketobacter sp.]
MTSQLKNHASDIDTGPSMTSFFWWLIALLVLSFVGYHAQVGPDSSRIANPDISEAARAAVEGLPLWASLCNYWTIALMTASIIPFTIAWRKYPRHPTLLMLIAGTALVIQDPIANWVSYSVFSPDLWHFPVDWPYVSAAPMVEPFVCIAYATVLVGPVFVAMPLLRRLQTRNSVDSFVWRHPLIALAGITFVIGFLLDAAVEIFCVSTRVYAYTQVPPFGSIFVGEYNQFPLLWESGLATAVMIPASILLYRDDTGKIQAEKLAQRLRLFANRPALATFLVMFATLNLAYLFIYGGGFLTIRAGGFATSVACPWPFPETKVYDPQGLYEKAGHPGPFYEGKWNTWASGQPEGRPVTEGPIPPGRCGPGRAEVQLTTPVTMR